MAGREAGKAVRRPSKARGAVAANGVVTVQTDQDRVYGFRWGLCLDFPHLVRKGVRKDGWLVKEERGGSGMWSQFFFSGPIKSQRMRQVLETIIEAGEKGLL